MKIDISTVIRQDDFIQGFKNGYSQIEATYGWTCPLCGEYVTDFAIETFSHYNRDNLLRETIITRSLEIENDDWTCDRCRKAKQRVHP